MDIFLFLTGGIGFLISIIFLFVNIIRKKKTKKPLIAGGICIFLFIVSLSMPVSTSPTAVENDNLTNKADNIHNSKKDAEKEKRETKENLKEVDINKKNTVEKDFSSVNTEKTKPVEKKAEDVISQPKENKTITLRFGKLLDSTVNGDTLIVKAKIEPSYNNKTTISQNGFNIEDLVLKQGGDKYSEIQYWAVADMQNGSEEKVISFTVNKGLIDSIKNKNIVGNQIVDNANDVWILPSLTQ